MRRRDFVALLGVASVTWPLAARAQQPDRMRRIGVLMILAESDPEGQARVGAFRDGLQKLGWIEGRNIRFDVRWSGGDPDRLRAYASELVGATPDVIFASANSALTALHQATRTVPIVFAQVPDPVGGGFVASLARPGGNITGFATFEYAVGEKWLELLREIAPGIARVAVIYDTANPNWTKYLRVIETATRSLAVELIVAPVRDATEIERVITAFAGEPNGGLIALNSPIIVANRERIIALAARHHLPTAYQFRFYAAGGGLVSYGVDNLDLHRRAADYVDRILRGEKPGELPVQLATKFELVINLKTAKALGLTVPTALLARADEVIE